jgi:hypothetical protein
LVALVLMLVKGDGGGTSNAPSNFVMEREIVSSRRENSFAFSANDRLRPSLMLSLKVLELWFTLRSWH